MKNVKICGTMYKKGDNTLNEHDEIDDILKEIKGKSEVEPTDDNDLTNTDEDNTADIIDTTDIEDIKNAIDSGDDGTASMPSDDEILSEIMGIIDGDNSETTQNVEIEHDFEEETEENLVSENNEGYLSFIEEPEKKINKPAIIAIAVAVVVIIAVAVTAVVKMTQKEPETTTSPTTTTTTTAAPVIYKNPLTGEEDYNKEADGKRPVAIVVENAYAARPQWGIDDEKNAPDIIVEGEVEGGESRMLWLFADYTSLPSQIGPIRSARPPYVNFSQLFDAIFLHWGMSYSKGDYVGANTVFKNNNIDHINQMAYSDNVNLFSRDKSRGVSSEHTGIIHGENVAAAIDGAGFRTEANEKSYTKFGFNESEKAVGETPCNTLALTFSSNTRTRDWTYNAEDKTYHSSDYSSNNGSSDVSRKNLLVLFDTTTYVSVYNYHGSGRSETYCNYGLTGGTGKLASLGTVIDINWTVENGVIKITDANGNEVNLNAGKTWIGYASSNHNGVVNIG